MQMLLYRDNLVLILMSGEHLSGIGAQAATEKKSDIPNKDIPQTAEFTGRAGLGFAAVEFTTEGTLNVGVLNQVTGMRMTVEGGMQALPHALGQLAEAAGVTKVVAAGVVRHADIDARIAYEDDNNLRRLLGQQDIVPIDVDLSSLIDPEASVDPDHKLLSVGQWLRDKFTPHGTAKVDVDPVTGKVTASRIATIADYREAYSETGHEQFFEETMDQIDTFAKALGGRKVYRWNTTAQAGGVAGMNHPMLRFFDEYNRLQNLKEQRGEEAHHINFEWRVLTPHIDPEIALKHGIDLKASEIIRQFGNPENPEEPISPFIVTKFKHNTIQGVEKSGERFTQTKQQLLDAWHETQAINQQEALQEEGAIHWFDDQQLDGYVKYAHPRAPKIFRSHIQFRSDLAADPTTPQHEVVEYFLNQLDQGGIDVFLSHRSRDAEMDAFLPKTIDGKVDPRIADKILYKVATADQVDGLGKRLTTEQQSYYLRLANEYLVDNDQESLDMSVGHWGQFARFDDAKDHLGAVKSQLLLANKMLDDGFSLDEVPECLIVGYGAPDDPDGTRVKNEVNELRLSPEFALVKDKIKVIRLDYAEYDDQTMKALEEICDIDLQISVAEGCEDKITQHIQDGRPVIVADTGGMPPQIVDGVSGYLVQPRDYEAISDHLFTYYSDVYPDPDKRDALSKQVKQHVKPEYTTLANIRDILGIAVLVADKRDQIPNIVNSLKAEKGEYPFVKDAIDIEYEELVAAETAHSLPTSSDVFTAPLTTSE